MPQWKLEDCKIRNAEDGKCIITLPVTKTAGTMRDGRFESLQAENKQLEAENKQLKGEEPIPFAWWKDCPKLAQRTMERLITRNDEQAKEIKQLKEAIKYTKEWCNSKIEQLKEDSRWIPVSERLPENIATVWILLYAKATESLCPSMGFYGENENGWGWEILGGGLLTEVTHWKPITLPKEVLNGK